MEKLNFILLASERPFNELKIEWGGGEDKEIKYIALKSVNPESLTKEQMGIYGIEMMGKIIESFNNPNLPPKVKGLMTPS